MSLTYDQISAITERKFLPKMVDNIFNSNPLLKRFKDKMYEPIDGGTSILAPLNYAQTASAGWYVGSQTLDTTDNDVITSAEYAWKALYGNISITRTDELKNSGAPAILNFVKSKVKITEKTLLDQMGTGIYSDGTDPTSIVGLRSIVGTANTVGGISQSSNSWWRAQTDTTTTTLSLSAMGTLYQNATIDNDSPTVVATTRTLFEAYNNLLQPQQRFMDPKMADAGFASLMFRGSPVMADSHCPSGYMFMVNENYLHLWYHKDEDFRFEPFQKPVNQNVKVAKIYWFGAFGSDNNRLHAGFSALTG